VLVHPTLPGILTVPRHPKVRKGTLRQIIAASGLTPEEFEELYR
jgi:predicted RNA binding protein YcfA (HicA-like mRNA interferase family)